jgi:hypothetical protein
MKSLWPLLFLILFVGCSKKDNPTTPNIVAISDLLPKDNEISNWRRSTGSDASWLASNSSELQQRIDGGFDLFVNHGFVEAAMQQFLGTVNSQADVQLEIIVYNQNTSAQADAVFDDPNNIFANPLAATNPPSAKAQVRKDIFSYTMKYTKGKYYVLVTIMSTDDKAEQVLEVFANNIASKIK